MALIQLIRLSKLTSSQIRATKYVRRTPGARWEHLIKTPIEIYVLSLFVADLIQGIGIVLGTRWINEGVVVCGTHCTIQGILQQAPETIVAMSTLAIAVHTFSIVFFKKGRSSISVAIVVVGIIWLYMILFVGITLGMHSNPNNPFYTPTPYWCWVNSHFTSERIIGEYGWLWITAIVSSVLYILLFLFLRGNLVCKDNSWRQIQFQRVNRRESVIHETAVAKYAFIMLLYPISYIGLIMGLSVVRWIDFIHPHQNIIPAPVIFLVQSILAMSGVVNVALLIYTRPGLLMVELLYPGGVPSVAKQRDPLMYHY